MADFRKIKETVSIKEVLEHYGIYLKGGGPEMYSNCPIHGGDNKSAFHVNTTKNVWYCHTKCGRGGSVIDLVAALKGIDIREAGRCIEMHFFKKEACGLPFRLTLKPWHPWLVSRGISLRTAAYFEVGYCEYGIMKGRIAIALYESENKLLAYMGRSITGDGPKYLFPVGFKKSIFLYNYFRMPEDLDEVIVVEGPFDLYRVFQCGYSNVVALLGSSPSEFQVENLSRFRRVYILLDGDEAGRRGANKLRDRLKPHGAEGVVLELPYATDPADMSEQDLTEFLNTSI